jgi:hypothetical protein
MLKATADKILPTTITGQSRTSYPASHMAGFDRDPKAAPVGGGGIAFPREHTLHDPKLSLVPGT